MFIFYMVSCFFTEFKTYSSSTRPIRDIKLIALQYIKGQFMFDILSLIPFNDMFHFNHSRIFLLLKILRLNTAS